MRRVTLRWHDSVEQVSATLTKSLGLISDRGMDGRKANQAVSLDAAPERFTWRHVEDGATMQLVSTSVHDDFRHAGNVAISKEEAEWLLL